VKILINSANVHLRTGAEAVAKSRNFTNVTPKGVYYLLFTKTHLGGELGLKNIMDVLIVHFAVREVETPIMDVR
jgi:hypothetical protein